METEIAPDERVSTALVRAVSAAEGRDPMHMRPLMDVIDPEALDDLFADRADGTPRTGGRLVIHYSDSLVTIESGEYITVELLDREPLAERTDRRVSDSRTEHGSA